MTGVVAHPAGNMALVVGRAGRATMNPGQVDARPMRWPQAGRARVAVNRYHHPTRRT